jgi:NAD+ synthase
MSGNILRAEVILPKIESWLRNKLEISSSKGCVVGLSGGIDSAVVAVILKRVCQDNMLAVMMPCHSIPQDLADAKLLIETFNIPSAIVDLSSTYDALTRETEKTGTPLSSKAITNVKPRLRMTTLYMLAQSCNYLVCGTSNLVETKLGYFTKYGDSGADILPIGDLLKGEVRDMARHLGIPEQIIDKSPSAGLWEGQTDEKEIGMTYEVIDRYFNGQSVSPKVTEKILKMIRSSEHKRKMPPVCTLR